MTSCRDLLGTFLMSYRKLPYTRKADGIRPAHNNHIVQILRDDDGHLTNNKAWHLIDPCNTQGAAALSTKEYFGEGEGRAVFKQRKGKVTCEACRKMIMQYQSVRL